MDKRWVFLFAFLGVSVVSAAEGDIPFYVSWLSLLFAWVVAPIIFAWILQVLAGHFVKSLDMDGKQGLIEEWIIKFVAHSKISFLVFGVFYFLIVLPSGLFRYIAGVGDFVFYDVSYGLSERFFSGNALTYFPFVFMGVLIVILVGAYVVFSIFKLGLLRRKEVKIGGGKGVGSGDVVLKKYSSKKMQVMEKGGVKEVEVDRTKVFSKGKEKEVVIVKEKKTVAEKAEKKKGVDSKGKGVKKGVIDGVVKRGK